MDQTTNNKEPRYLFIGDTKLNRIILCGGKGTVFIIDGY